MFHGACQRNCYLLGHSSDETDPMSVSLRFPWWQLAVMMLGLNSVAKFALSSG